MDVDRVDIHAMVQFLLEDVADLAAMLLGDALIFAVSRDLADGRAARVAVVDVVVDLLLDEQVDRLDRDRGQPVIGERANLLQEVIGLMRVARENQVRPGVDRDVGRERIADLTVDVVDEVPVPGS